MASEPRTLADEDLALLERVASRIVELRLDTPAMLALETVTPVSLLAGQALVFFEPVAIALLRLRDYRRFARLIERRNALAALGRLIEARSREAQEARHRRPRPGAAGAGGSDVPA